METRYEVSTRSANAFSGFAFALVIATVAGGCGSTPSVELQAKEPGGEEVVVRAVRRLAQPTYVAVSGEIEGRRTVNVGFQVAGVVDNVPLDEGDIVQAGGTLAELQTDAYKLGLQAA